MLKDSGSSIVVEPLPHHQKVKGLSPATAAGIGRKNRKNLHSSEECQNPKIMAMP
jgi:hypothetical protein